MRASMVLLRKRLLFLLVPALFGAAYLGSTVLSSSTKKDKTTIKVNNLTRSAELISVEKHKDHLKFSVQNNSDKAITAFVLTIPLDPATVFTYTQEFAFSENDTVIPPGQSYDAVIGVPGVLNGRPEITVDVSGVIYEDNSAEGNPDIIRDVKDDRLGEKIQLTSTIPFLERMLALPDRELQAALKDFKGAVTDALNISEKNLSAQPEEQSLQSHGQPAERRHLERVKAGLKTGQESVLRHFQELERLQEAARSNALRGEILRLKQRYERIISKL